MSRGDLSFAFFSAAVALIVVTAFLAAFAGARERWLWMWVTAMVLGVTSCVLARSWIGVGVIALAVAIVMPSFRRALRTVRAVEEWKRRGGDWS